MTYDETPKTFAELKPPGYWSKAAGRFIPVHEMTEEDIEAGNAGSIGLATFLIA